jgi:hypothetical protein
MLRRYFKLKPFVRESAFLSAELADVAMTPLEDQDLLEFVENDLADLHSVTTLLQSQDGVTLATSRALFDGLIAKYPELERGLGANAAIIQNNDFENAVVKILDGKAPHNDLTPGEVTAMARFRLVPPVVAAADEEEDIDPALAAELDFAKQLLSGRKRNFAEAAAASDDAEIYSDLSWIPPTSSMVERLFSRAKLTLGHLRRAMTPDNLNMLLILLINGDLWDVGTSDEIFKAATGIPVEEDAEDLENERDDNEEE